MQSSRQVHSEDKVQVFQQLMLCSRSSVLHMGTLCPELLSLEAPDLMMRLVAIKVRQAYGLLVSSAWLHHMGTPSESWLAHRAACPAVTSSP